METQTILVTLVLIPAGSLASWSAHTNASVADTNIPDNEVTSSLSEANNSSGSATIMITWTTVSLPDE